MLALAGTPVTFGNPADSTDFTACPFCRFAGYLWIPWGPLASGTATFKLYVDGALAASSQATYQLVHR